MVEPTIKARLELVPSGGAVGGTEGGGVFSPSEQRAFRLEQLKAFKLAALIGGGNISSLVNILTALGPAGAIAVAVGGISLVIGDRIAKMIEEFKDYIDDKFKPPGTVTEAATDIWDLVGSLFKSGRYIPDVLFGGEELAEQAEDTAQALDGMEGSIGGFGKLFNTLRETIPAPFNALFAGLTAFTAQLGSATTEVKNVANVFNTVAQTGLWDGGGGPSSGGGGGPSSIERLREVDPTGGLALINVLSQNAPEGTTAGDILRMQRLISSQIESQGQQNSE